MSNKKPTAQVPYSFERFQQNMNERGYYMLKRDSQSGRIQFMKDGGMTPITINYPDFCTEDGHPAYEKSYVVDFFMFVNGLRPDGDNGFHFDTEKKD